MPISIDAIGAAYAGATDSIFSADTPRPIQADLAQPTALATDEELGLVDAALETMAVAMAKFTLHFGQQELQKIMAANEAKLKELNQEEG